MAPCAQRRRISTALRVATRSSCSATTSPLADGDNTDGTAAHAARKRRSRRSGLKLTTYRTPRFWRPPRPRSLTTTGPTRRDACSGPPQQLTRGEKEAFAAEIDQSSSEFELQRLQAELKTARENYEYERTELEDEKTYWQQRASYWQQTCTDRGVGPATPAPGFNSLGGPVSVLQMPSTRVTPSSTSTLLAPTHLKRAAEFIRSVTWAMLTSILTVASGLCSISFWTICDYTTATFHYLRTWRRCVHTGIVCTTRYQYPFTGQRSLANGSWWTMVDWQTPYPEYCRQQENLQYGATYPVRYHLHWSFENYLFIPISDTCTRIRWHRVLLWDAFVHTCGLITIAGFLYVLKM